jgi:hydroxymethylglutaryl-CoA lyase
MSDAIKVVECPRDAWQGLPGAIPAEVKAAYLRALIGAGFTHIDAVSFVSPKAVPQMADSEKVLELLDAPEQVEIIGIVVNKKGAERAIATGTVSTLGFPYSISPQFLLRNQNQTQEESLHTLKEIFVLAAAAGLNMVAYLSMAFGNPYDEPWSIDEVVRSCERLTKCGGQQISLADTVGLASPERIAETVAAVAQACDAAKIGVHLHARRGEAEARIRAAFDAGCRRFDAAIGGLGGCPFAQDALVGNIPTEILLGILRECGAESPGMKSLDIPLQMSAEIAAKYGAAGGRV